ncbi:MAG: hydantoinase/oxoprolinase family protein [Saprospiraceae bacterium]|nr:hydantoinase/oxoprolinase family protein [Saprospiraceae bacterium]MDW8228210.1 hydantoinase/oxoprolinase family protein [Saprospiraceae bacterium]
MKLGIDIGGTFTDLVLLDEDSGRMVLGKTLTTYPDPLLGILNGVKQITRDSGVPLPSIGVVVHGTTLITNAVIERKGARTALLTTAGFEDVLEIGREMRYDIYDLFLTMPKPLIPRSLRIGIRQRMNKDGQVLTPLDLAEVEHAAERLIRRGVQSMAVSFLHAFANPEHEQAVGDLLRRKYPHLSVSLSSEVLPEIREYERTSATVMNAYTQPLIQDYLRRLKQALVERGFQGEIFIMNSAGRLTTLDGAQRFPIQLLESGPAGGTMASVFFQRQLVAAGNDIPQLLAFDMGGTTAKASMVRRGQPEITHHFEAARERRFKKGSGLPVRIPVIDMIEIGAGGGSIARLDALGLLTVGPDSAASQPGPACYGRGGQWPTVTDADLVLGFLNEHYFLGGTMPLRRDLAEKAIEKHIARPLGIRVEEAAWGIHRIVNENMANAARVHILEKGFDPRSFTMMAFGGAGPVHAFAVARLLGLSRLIIPGGAGVLSALGFLVSPVATEAIFSHVSRLDRMEWTTINTRLADMERSGRTFLQETGLSADQIQVSRMAEMRYAGQGHEITVPLPVGTLSAESLPAIMRNFGEEYALRYGRTLPHMPIESVTWRTVVSGPPPQISLYQQVKGAVSQQAQKDTRPAFFGKTWIEVPVLDRYTMPTEQRFSGPCIIEEFESTTVVGPDAAVWRDDFGNLIIEMF